MNTAVLELVLSIIIILIVIITIIICIARYCRFIKRAQKLQGYDIVRHELDEEEVEFQRTIEGRGGSDTGKDDIEELFNSEELEEFSFDSKDQNRLDMLEKLRNNLVKDAALDAANEPGWEEESENDQIRL